MDSGGLPRPVVIFGADDDAVVGSNPIGRRGRSTERSMPGGNWMYRALLIGPVACAVIGGAAGVCLAMESLVSEIVGAPVHQCCIRDARPRCCFHIGNASSRAR